MRLWGKTTWQHIKGCDYNPRLGADVTTLETVCRGQTAMDGMVVCPGRVFAVSRSYKVHPKLGSVCERSGRAYSLTLETALETANDQTTEACGTQSRAGCGEFGGTQWQML